MSWWAVFRTSDGVLVSTGTIVADPLSPGLSRVEIAQQPDRDLAWDPATRTLIPRQPSIEEVESELAVLDDEVAAWTARADAADAADRAAVTSKRDELVTQRRAKIAEWAQASGRRG